MVVYIEVREAFPCDKQAICEMNDFGTTLAEGETQHKRTGPKWHLVLAVACLLLGVVSCYYVLTDFNEKRYWPAIGGGIRGLALILASLAWFYSRNELGTTLAIASFFVFEIPIFQ